MKGLNRLVGACFSTALLAACGGGNNVAPSAPTMVAPPIAAPQSAATNASGSHRKGVHYRIVQLPTLGGPEAFANWINDRGWVTGAADLPGGKREHAFLWQHNQIRDLGTLGGRNSLAWGINDAGDIGGSSDTSTKDPYDENFCNFIIDGKPEHSTRTCLGFIWSHGTLTALPTLGGNNGGVQGTNNRGQFAGNAETSTVDPNCMPPQVLDFDGAVWERNGRVHALLPLAGDAIASALAINDAGQAVGGSGVCANPPISTHAVLWRRNRVVNLGGFGGTANNVAFDINNRGQVAGFSDLASDTTAHAFLWQNHKLSDLGTLKGDFASFAFGINDRGQVVGQSCDASFNCRAFIWQNGVMTDLNTLVSADSSLQLMLAESINQNGVIAGIAYDPATGGIPAYLAIPQRGGVHAHPRSTPVLPADVRKRIQQMSARGRFEAPLLSGFTKP